MGNLLFTNSVFRAVNVRGATTVSDSLLTELPGGQADEYIDRINNEFDLFVIPLANAFRPQYEASLKRLTTVIRRLKIPVVVTGVGVQALEVSEGGLSAGQQLDTSAREFMTAVLERSASVGVRGERTAAYLSALGFGQRNVEIIGCPSLYDQAVAAPMVKRVDAITETSPLAINITPSAPGIGGVVQHNVEKYRDLVYVPQEHHELGMLLWGDKIKHSDARLPLHADHELYREDRIRFFVDPASWYEFMRGRDFAFGTRIHGTIAALAAGTPGVLISHDERTRELADYHRIPYHQADDSSVFDAAALYEGADFSEFNAFRAESFQRYTEFLEHNDVAHIFTPGNENPDYDAQLAATAYPEGVGPIGAAGTDAVAQLIDRVRWLRQGAGADKKRGHGGYVPPFRPAPGRNPDQKIIALQKRLDAAIARIEKLEAEPEAEPPTVRNRISAAAKKLRSTKSD
ncbi:MULTISPECIES: polysaccharide pyruvyl transferase family protein [unclassified Leifsonia]|uniref:polysaccharide pyruvyl transferase family protein n=1 Tax=unclassified Leifsonia TaxID=2663824 RepID=UPI00138F2136|nr:MULTISPECIES: polysaccharide pyruvyl transferase family protein [unclassified Leifsonia]